MVFRCKHKTTVDQACDKCNPPRDYSKNGTSIGNYPPNVKR